MLVVLYPDLLLPHTYILDSSIYLDGTVTNTKASATLVTVHLSTNLYIIFTFHHLLTYWLVWHSLWNDSSLVREHLCDGSSRVPNHSHSTSPESAEVPWVRCHTSLSRAWSRGCLGGLLFYWGGSPIKVETLSLTKFSWLLSLLLNAIGNIRQSLKNPPSTTPRLEEFSLLVIVRSLHGTKHYGTWCRNKLLISKTFFLVSYHVSSNCCFCWTKQLEYSCSRKYDSRKKACEKPSNSKIASL